MKLIHLADTHLGFRQYYRLTPAGINAREADIANTFRRAIGRIIELRPDVIVIAGDIFHTSRPTNTAIVHAYQQFARLRQALPETEVVLIAGNHDRPRVAVEAGSILRLFATLGIHIAESQAETIRLGELAVCAVPETGAPAAMEPQASAKWNVLLFHGEVEGMLSRAAHPDRPATAVPLDRLGVGRWDYVALGHYHVHKRIADRAYYSGSIDYTSSNPWGELEEQRRESIPGKGMVEVDLDTGAVQFHELAPSRTLVDLAPIHGAGLGPKELDAAVAERVASCDGGIEGKIVRCVLRAERIAVREMDPKPLRDWKRSAFNFQLDVRKPEAAIQSPSAYVGRKRKTLEEMLAEHIDRRFTAAGLDPAALKGLGLGYLRETEGEIAS